MYFKSSCYPHSMDCFFLFVFFYNPNDNQVLYLVHFAIFFIAWSARKKLKSYTVYGAKPLLDLNFRVFIFCMASVHNAQEIVKIICRDCLLQDSSILAFSGIINPTHPKDNRFNYLKYSLYCRYHSLL